MGVTNLEVNKVDQVFHHQKGGILKLLFIFGLMSADFLFIDTELGSLLSSCH
jgi:hypothetical protein